LGSYFYKESIVLCLFYLPSSKVHFFILSNFALFKNFLHEMVTQSLAGVMTGVFNNKENRNCTKGTFNRQESAHKHLAFD
jgi:hypothetical protein